MAPTKTMRKVLNKTPNKTPIKTSNKTLKKTPKKEFIKEGPAKGLPVSLLSKIKPKGQLSEEEIILDRERRVKKLKNVAKIVHCHFTLHPTTIPLNALIERISPSYFSSFHASISETEVKSQVECLLQLFPEWILACTVRNTHYVKLLDRSKAYVQIEEKILNAIF